MSHAADLFKSKFLLAALPDVPFDGWTNELMARTAKRLKLSDEKLRRSFPSGIEGLVVYFFEWATAETLRQLEKKDLNAVRVRDRITLGVRTQLEILQPRKQEFSAAMAFLALPPRNFLLPRMLWHAADKLWWAAGDTATDYNHYTKRLLLAGVITSTTLYWLNDASKGQEQTWAFLDRRIENVLKIGQKIARFKKRKEN